MSHTFDDLSFPFVMDLLRTKRNAQGRGDTKAVESLKHHYPWLFSGEFQIFVKNLESVMEDIEARYGENLSSLFEADIGKNIRNIH
jgi:hypothetical protein